MLDIIVLGLLNGIIFTIYCYLVCYLLLQRKETNLKQIFLAFFTFIIPYYCTLYLLDSIYSIFFSGLIAFLLIRMIFKENIFMSLFLSLIIHIAKVSIKMIILAFINNDKILLINTYKTLDWTDFYIDLIVIIISSIVILTLRKPLRKLVQHITISKNRKLVLLALIYIAFLAALFYQPPENFISLRTVTDFLMIFTVTGIGIFNISSEMKMEILNRHYQEIFEYSKANGELLTKYKMQVHEAKNRLLMINGLLEGPKKEVKKYIDTLLKEMNANRNNSNYWLAELKYIPLAGVRNFINYKLIQLKELGCEIEVFVSSELETINTSRLDEKLYNDLSTVLGVILDNMIESIKETDDRLVSLNIYLENNKVKCDFVNSFSGNIDLNRLNEIGYTTKGEQHGVGLSLVAKIIKENSRFECKPEVMDNFFIQHLTINLLNKKTMQKNSKK